ncbi:glycosyltransferase family 4 protein [Metabacillus litoralis]|uniref:Glycosyltransferase family 4 protein n=1 Tax=Metabacillus litoralis TaxID=152268 RepID=A0A5C6V9K3_9BACI|nr:glycosyltransferase [Metabacillus litoralis]TXC82183.1 glycosyltransferase family 4 protein [Metabacillus litoralis]
MREKNKNPKIMMHYVLPGATGGPNILFSRIENETSLKQKYNFVALNQKRVAGGKINLSLILELKNAIQKEKPDIIHISGMQSTGFHCMIAALLAGCKNRLVTTHGFSGDSLGGTLIKNIAFNYIIEPITLSLATRVHGISKYTVEKKMVRRYARKKTCLIYNFPPDENELSKNSNVRDKLGIGIEEVIFTTVSRIVLDKGYRELAKAIKNLRELKNIRFLIVGDGKYEDAFRDEVSEEINSGKVIMLGKRNDVMNILDESDVFILPTLHENLGNVYLEASKVCIPSIGTKVGGVPEIILDGETGLLIPPYNSEALTEAIMKLYSKPHLRKEMGIKAHRRLNDYFNPVTISNQFDDLYSSILNRKK